MPAPTNISFATAQNIGSVLPVTVMQDQAFGGTTFQTFYRIPSIPAGVNEISVFLQGNETTWIPTLDVFLGPAGSPTQIPNSAPNGIAQVPVNPGDEIFIQSTKKAGNPAPAVSTLTVKAGPRDVVPANISIAINDSSLWDVNPFPAVFISSVDGHILNFFHPFPAGESCRILTTGELLAADDFALMRAGSGPILFDKNLNIIASPVMPAAGYLLYGTDQTTGWWCMKPGGGATHALAIFVDKTGTVIGAPLDMGATSAGSQALTPNLANTALYFVQSTGLVNSPIQKVTVPGGVVTTIVAGDANFFLTPGIYTLLDDTFVEGYNSNVGTSNEVRRFDSTGALLNTYAVGIGQHIEQLFPMPDDPVSIGVWTQTAIFSRYRRIRVADGAVLFDVSTVKFESGVSDEAATLTPTAFFGNDFSCEPWVPRFDLFVPTPPPPTTCTCVDVINIGGPVPNGLNLTNAIALGGFFEIGDIDMLFGEQRFIIPHQQINVSGASQQFTITDEAMGLMIVTTNGDPIRWLVSGETPTGSNGNLARDGTVFVIANITNAKNFRFILDGASATAQVCANFSRP